MKHAFFMLLLILNLYSYGQEKEYYKGGQRIDPSLVDEQVGDSAKKVNTIFLFKNENRSHLIKILNLAGRTYGQAISEFVKLDFNSKKGGDLHRKVEKLTNLKIEDGKLVSDQLKASFVFLKEKGINYERVAPPIKLMICSTNKNGKTTCRLSEEDIEISPDEILGKYPHTAFTRLGYEDLKNIKSKELNIMKKEIYARYGYNFSEKEDANYFYNQNWYEPIVGNNLIELNELEEDNIAMISLFQGEVDVFKSINKKPFSQIFSIETTAASLYDLEALKSTKYIKQDSLGGNKCVYTEYNKMGVSTFKQNCMINETIYLNYFQNNFLAEHINQQRDTYYYYKNGLPYKSVKLDYQTETTEVNYFNYDDEDNIVEKQVYQNNDYNSTTYYDYDAEGNLIKEYYKDEEDKEQTPTIYFYDDENINIGYLRNNEYGCDYSYNDPKDIITEVQCYKLIDDIKEARTKTKKDVLEIIRGKHKRIISVKLSEYENFKYGLSITEVKYY